MSSYLINDPLDGDLARLPGDAVDDMELSTLHMRFLVHVGRQDAQRGWVRISQTELAQRWQCSRPRLNAAIKLLVKKRYIRELRSEKTGEAWCAYQIVLDTIDVGRSTAIH